MTGCGVLRGPSRTGIWRSPVRKKGRSPDKRHRDLEKLGELVGSERRGFQGTQSFGAGAWARRYASAIKEQGRAKFFVQAGPASYVLAGGVRTAPASMPAPSGIMLSGVAAGSGR